MKPLSRALESVCKVKPFALPGSNAAGLGRAALLISLLFLYACGKQAAPVAPPAVPVPAPAAAPKAPIPKQQPPQPPAPEPRPSDSDSAPRSVTPETEPPKPVAPAAAPATVADFVAGPLIRIGLSTDLREIAVTSSGEYFVTEKKAEAARHLVRGALRVRVEREGEKTSDVFRVQVASFTQIDLAQQLLAKLSEELPLPAAIHKTAAGLNQVRVGEFASKEQAQSAAAEMSGAGYPGAFVVREAASVGGGKAAVALRGEETFLLSAAGFLLQPSSRTDYLSIDGKPYRGVIDISLNENGRLSVVNQVGMEEYLLGVVPAEINPNTYPEPAALAAQAIAARTYAMKNLGRYRSQGFDLTADTRTQVYGGVAAEKEATTQAVIQTAGLALYHQDKLIDAMYMSTCGGRTEDFSEVFDSKPVPYLKGVVCAIESGPDKNETVLYGKHDLQQPVLTDDGMVANRNIEFARVLKIADPETELSPEFLAGEAERSEIVRWVANARKAARKDEQGGTARTGSMKGRAEVLQYAAEAFFGAAEIRRKISPRDVEYYLGNLTDGNSVPEPARPSLSYLIQTGLWRPFADNTVRPRDPMRRGDLLALLLSWVESSRSDILKKGTFVSAGPVKEELMADAAISVKRGNRTEEFRFAQRPYLFRVDAGRVTPVSSARIIGNEKISFHTGPDGTIDFMEIELNPTGASSDRYSPAATWDMTLSRSAAGEKLRSLAGNIGELRDLKPHQIGDSGRVVKIQAVGSRASAVLNGYKVRNALGLRDTLFTLTRTFNADGTVESFTFHGRGWGHGVGLCQVGAFGMARAGRNYEEILKHYYQGVEIRKAY